MAIFFIFTYIDVESQAVSHHVVLKKNKENSLQSLKRKKKTFGMRLNMMLLWKAEIYHVT